MGLISMKTKVFSIMRVLEPELFEGHRWVLVYQPGIDYLKTNIGWVRLDKVRAGEMSQE